MSLEPEAERCEPSRAFQNWGIFARSVQRTRTPNRKNVSSDNTPQPYARTRRPAAQGGGLKRAPAVRKPPWLRMYNPNLNPAHAERPAPPPGPAYGSCELFRFAWSPPSIFPDCGL